MTRLLASGASLEQVERMMTLQERYESNEARKAYVAAMADFKSEAVEIIKRREVDFTNSRGTRTNYKHAELSDVIEAVGPALSRHGFSWSWSTAQGEKWIDVTCTLRHKLGHSESVTLGGPPDESGGKNTIQAIVSAKTYLERHTLKAVCGVAEKGEDTDANAPKGPTLAEFWGERVANAADEKALEQVKRDGAKAFTEARDVPGYQEFSRAAAARRQQLRGAGRA